MNERSIAGKVVLITGAARGLGAGVARTLAARGARVALVGLEPEELARQVVACGNGARAWTADVSDQEQISRAADGVREHYGRIDVLVANAGVATGGTLRIADPRAYDRVIEVNLLGSVRTVRAVMPHLIESRGYYLQLSSGAALVHGAGMGSYVASKAGVEAFAHSIRGEVRHLGVDVGVAYLIWTESDMTSGITNDPALRVAHEAVPWPLNRVYPAAAAIETLADGVARRRAHVMIPRGLWAGYALRAVTPTILALAGGRFTRLMEGAHAQQPHTLGLMGPGGAADDAART